MPFVVKRAGEKTKPLTARIYLQDPFVAAREPSIGIETIELETLEPVVGPGPTTSRVRVVDFNADLSALFDPAHPLANETGYRTGATNPLENVKFHQVNVWAVVNRTLAYLENERVFGRRVPWGFDCSRLTLIPHAGYWENAYYDRRTGALHFFYFEGHDGSPVFTCLSHDIITHELGHAVLDGLKPYYNEITSPATAGFHEFFGDAVALAMKLTHRAIAVHVAGRQDAVNAANVITNIAAGFGAGLADEYGSLANAYLRSAANDKTMTDIAGVLEEHRYSEVLTGAYYSLLRKTYEKRLRAAIRDPERPNDAAGQRRVRGLISASRITARMLFRAIDYCPPVDVQFLDYARAAVRSDQVAYPIDVEGHRRDLIDVFLDREIATTEQELTAQISIRNDELRDLDVERLAASHTDAADFINANRGTLSIPPEVDIEVTNVYRTIKLSSSGYRPPQEVIIEFVWAEDLALTGDGFGQFQDAIVPLWCGGTLVFSRDGNILHYALKTATDERRTELRRYIQHLITTRALTPASDQRGVGSATHASPITARIDGSRLNLHRSAALRHHETRTP